MTPRVYVETSVISYLAAKPSRDLVVAGHQQITAEWWQVRKSAFEVWASELVVEECARGNAETADARLRIVSALKLLRTGAEAAALAHALVQRGPLPRKAAADALHIALAATAGIDYLLTWNCKHIANAEMRPMIERICRGRGYEPPVLCTPEELMGD